jgi:hypothetical protein
MSAPWTRRRLLVGLGSGALAGCLGEDDGEATTGSPASPAETDASEERRTPTPPCEVEADLPTSDIGPPYPPLSVDSAALALDFALAFEEALQRNRVQILEPAASYVRLDSDDTTEPRSTDAGYLVGVRVVLAYGREVHTSDDPDAESFHDRRSASASYFVGDRALRVGTAELGVVDPRDAADGEIVACGE